MRTLLIVALLLASCSSDPDDPAQDMGAASDTATSPDGGDTGEGPDGSQPDTGTDVGTSFCALADCGSDTPQCSELLQRCVQCTANSDCATAPLLTCETLGDGAGGDPLYECVECTDDSVCGGGTCDLATHVCMP